MWLFNYVIEEASSGNYGFSLLLKISVSNEGRRWNHVEEICPDPNRG